jgi:hypothetical protein
MRVTVFAAYSVRYFAAFKRLFHKVINKKPRLGRVYGCVHLGNVSNFLVLVVGRVDFVSFPDFLWH